MRPLCKPYRMFEESISSNTYGRTLDKLLYLSADWMNYGSLWMKHRTKIKRGQSFREAEYIHSYKKKSIIITWINYSNCYVLHTRALRLSRIEWYGTVDTSHELSAFTFNAWITLLSAVPRGCRCAQNYFNAHLKIIDHPSSLYLYELDFLIYL